MNENAELFACSPLVLTPNGFNTQASLPYGLEIAHVRSAMQDFLDFLGFINVQLYSRGTQRIESILMQANFSSIVGEFMSAAIPKYCPTLIKNAYHNGHPDLIPVGLFANNSIRHASEGIEIKASRYLSGWQGHNPEDTWLMVFVYDSNRPVDAALGVAPKPFRFLSVVGARLVKDDWSYSGRSGESRRTITASVKRSGFNKMTANWIYKIDPAEAVKQAPD